MTIYRTNHTDSFTTFSNAFINSRLPSDCKNVLIHLLSKPSNWKLVKAAIAKTLGLSKYAVQQAVTQLRKLGYLTFHRTKTGHGVWHVYESPRPTEQPQTSVVKPSLATRTLAPQTELQNTDNLQNNEITTTAAETNNDLARPEKLPFVVVTLENNHDEDTQAKPETIAKESPRSDGKLSTVLINPDSCDRSGDHGSIDEQKALEAALIRTEVEKLTVAPALKPIIARTLAEATLDECKKILTVLSHALVKNEIKNPVGYVIQLVRASQNGTLTVATASNQLSLSERIAKQKREQQAREQSRISNDEWLAMMRARGINVSL